MFPLLPLLNYEKGIRNTRERIAFDSLGKQFRGIGGYVS